MIKPRRMVSNPHITIEVRVEVISGADKERVGREIVEDIRDKFRYTNRDIEGIRVEVVATD